ncbi:MAG: rhomboid family intramembrane serine protease [Bacteroidales bacterium]|jgi:membrane associated rhomboid family serine protease|nr:rhomboid family intramembrane serine protease [Bacteroidales bacterium]
MENNDQYRVGRFSMLPPAVKNLLILNFIVWLLDLSLQTRGIDIAKWLGLHYITAENFYPWQYVTYMFLHQGFSHIFFNMFALWMFGYAIENAWGSKRFLLYYFVTGIGAGIVQTVVVGIDVMASFGTFLPDMNAIHLLDARAINSIVTIGASGAVFGILLAFGMMFPNMHIYLYFLLPIKAKWFVIAYGVLELVAGISGSGDNIAHFAHLGGMLFGIGLILYWRKYGSRIR